MRIAAAIILLLMTAAVVFGIDYVPRHDGSPSLFLVTIVLPTLAICWSIWRLFPNQGS